MWLYEFTIGETVLFVHPDWSPFMGAYNIATQYAPGDYVSYLNGSVEGLYWHITYYPEYPDPPPLGQLPTDSNYWGLASVARAPSSGVEVYNMAPAYFIGGEQRDYNTGCAGMVVDGQYIYATGGTFWNVGVTWHSKHGVVRVNKSTMASDLFVGDVVVESSGGGSADTEFANPYGIILINYNERAPRLWSPFAAGRP